MTWRYKVNIRVEWVTCRHFLLVSTWTGCQKHAQETEFVSNYSVKNVQLDLKSDRAVVIDLDKNNPLSQQHSSPASFKPLYYQNPSFKISVKGYKLSMNMKYHLIFLGSSIINLSKLFIWSFKCAFILNLLW